MSDVPSNVEAMVETVADATAEATAPIAEAVAAVTKPVAAVTKSVTKPVAKAVASPAKRVSKPRAKVAKSRATATKVVEPIVAPIVKAVRKAKRTATAKIIRRKYVRKSTAATKQAAAPFIQGIKTMNDTNWFANLTPTMPGADKFQSMFGDVSAKSQDVVKKGQVFVEQITEAAKANVEAVVESSKIAAAGARDLGTEIVATTKSSVERAQSAVKTLAEAKSPTEFFQLQSEMLKASFDRMVADGSKLTEQMVKLAGEAAQPLSSRASVNAEKFSELTA